MELVCNVKRARASFSTTPYANHPSTVVWLSNRVLLGHLHCCGIERFSYPRTPTNTCLQNKQRLPRARQASWWATMVQSQVCRVTLLGSITPHRGIFLFGSYSPSQLVLRMRLIGWKGGMSIQTAFGLD
ncbi:hypothetical protein DEO72_LG3g1566 [Vigna unguiculata]|uniref:Uncharacterized protein n=1 Tax=Vigna unguiculata TaxID=3917 RepID=A0A4D6LFB8_VIGUN|nr:hypothetical protein DEO72_LG3g1566 [Vigna unguiculata]